MKLTQPVMIQSFKGGLELPEGKSSNTPAIPGSVVSEGKIKNQVDDKTWSTYPSGVRKLLHMMRWTRPEIMNAVRELSRFTGRALQLHVVARAMAPVDSYINSNRPPQNMACRSQLRNGSTFNL
jgi:hypothetical protein